MTPTLLQQYLQCPTRAGFAQDPSTQQLKRTGLRAALGIVAHAVQELKSPDVGFDQAWERAAQRAYEDLLEEWRPAEPPSPNHWPGAALTRARTARQWADATSTSPAGAARPLTTTPSSYPAVATPVSPGALPWRERWLTIPNLDLAGKPDLVDRVDGKLRVIDFKTGLHQGEPTESQRTQLLFYCRLVAHHVGTPPDLAAIQNASGDLFPVEVVPADLTTVEQLATRALADLSTPGPTRLEARPSEETCGTCPFRLVCDAFLGSYSPDWRSIPVRVGVVTGVAHGAQQVDVSVLAPAWAPDTMRLIGFPFPQTVTPGQVWGFMDFEGRSRTGIARWNTLAFQWPDSD